MAKEERNIFLFDQEEDGRKRVYRERLDSGKKDPFDIFWEYRSRMQKRKEEKIKDSRAVMKEYIKQKYVTEHIIPREIYKVFPNLTEEQIKTEVGKYCRKCRKIQKPIIVKDTPKLFIMDEVCQDMIVLNDNQERVPFVTITENFPLTYQFFWNTHNYLMAYSVLFWKPPEVIAIENELKKIPTLHFRTMFDYKTNFIVVKGFFESQLLNVIIVNSDLIRPGNKIKYHNEKVYVGKKSKVQDFEIGELLNQIIGVLSESGLEYKNDTRLLFVKGNAFDMLMRIQSNRQVLHNKCKAFLTLGKDSNMGFIIEYEDVYKTLIEKLPYIKLIEEIGELEELKKENEKDMVILQNFNDLVTKRKIFYSPESKKKYKYDMATMGQIVKYLNKEDIERLIEIFPEALYAKFKFGEINPETDEERKDSFLVTKLMIKLERMNNGEMFKYNYIKEEY